MNEHKIIEVENEKSDSEDHLIIESVNLNFILSI